MTKIINTKYPEIIDGAPEIENLVLAYYQLELQGQILEESKQKAKAFLKKKILSFASKYAKEILSMKVQGSKELVIDSLVRWFVDNHDHMNIKKASFCPVTYIACVEVTDRCMELEGKKIHIPELKAELSVHVSKGRGDYTAAIWLQEEK
jgi:hypothetical protein